MKVSDCCGAEVRWVADTENTYTQADAYGAMWECRKCSKSCTPVEVSEVRRPTSDKKWEVGDE